MGTDASYWSVLDVVITLSKQSLCGLNFILTCNFHFRTCGISNALDRTEDNKLYNEEGQEINDDEDHEFETESKGKSEGESEADGE